MPLFGSKKKKRDESKDAESKDAEAKDETKDESKDAKESADAEDVIDVTGIKVAPNDCAFDEPLELDIEFSTRRPLRGAHWRVGYLVDTVARKRHIVELGRTEPADYDGAAPSGKQASKRQSVFDARRAEIKRWRLVQF